MQSKASTVDEYLLEVPTQRLVAVKKIRRLCLQELKGYEEIMQYGGPCYIKNGIVEVGFFSQKHFIGLYILKQDVMKKYKDELKNVSTGKGVIRFTKPEKIDFEIVRKMLADTCKSQDIICG